ncbi:MAG: penicillin-binding protein, partial [Actinobacteria bacterium]|nr:penicillin-binding protein [Actinomycetota bacterium]
MTRSDKKSGPRRRIARFLWILPVFAVLVGIALLVAVYAFASVPLPEQVKLASAAEVYDRNNELIGIYSGEERRFLIDTAELPPYVGQAVVASEDRDFYEHSGVSIRGIARAAWANITGGEVTQGGSTITQQYVKQAVLQDPSRTLTRKGKEAILAIKLERRFSKRRILGFYLNTIYLGRGAYGIEAAARSYFDKAATELTLSEAAFLAGIIPSPESYQPDEDPKLARDRRDNVLAAMEDEGYISAREAEHAARRKVTVSDGASSGVEESRAAYFMEWLRKEYLDPALGDDLYTSGLKIYTTLDLGMQDQAEDAVSSLLTERSEPQAALVSITPTGAVRALVGGRDFMNVSKARGFNYATDNARQPGSAFKPFTLLAAIEKGVSPESTFTGASPTTIEDP